MQKKVGTVLEKKVGTVLEKKVGTEFDRPKKGVIVFLGTVLARARPAGGCAWAPGCGVVLGFLTLDNVGANLSIKHTRKKNYLTI